MPERVEPGEGYIRTEAAESELRAPRHGLSLSQRKLLTLIDGSPSIEHLGDSLHSDAGRVRRDLARLLELGLVRSTRSAMPKRAVEPIGQAAPQARMQPPSKRRRTGATITALIVLAVAGIVIWPLNERRSNQAVDAEPTRPIAPPAATAIAASLTSTPASDTVVSASSVPVLSDATFGARPESQTSSRPPGPVRLPGSVDAPEPKRAERPVPVTAERRPEAPVAVTSRGNSIADSPGAVPAAVAAITTTTPGDTARVPQPVTARSVASLNEVVSTASVASHRASEANPPVQLATAPATSAPATIPPPRLVPIVREEPEFPREAMLSNITRGRVVARLTIDQEGHVSKVDIVSAEPRRVFDRSVNRALSLWRFEPSTAVRTTEVEVDFKAN